MPLAATAVALLCKFRSGRNEHAKRVHSHLLNTLIRHAPGPVYVSQAAQLTADKWKLGSLSSYDWHDQTRKMGDTRRKVFAWDHFYTVADLRRRIEALEDPTEHQVRRILKVASVAWILKSEDRELTKRGYRSKRPDPFAAYEEAGIRLIALKG